MNYQPPLKDTLFVLEELAHLDEVAALPGLESSDPETAQAILEECATLCASVIAPLNARGDESPARCNAGVVSTTAGFKDAYDEYVRGGWQGLQHPPEFGGQGLAKTIATATTEFLNGANMSFALCPLLTDGAIEALLTAGSASSKSLFLSRMISGEWTGSMNLTEPDAGSDLGRVRTRAEPCADGSYRLFGTKIFITYGEHDLAANIIHLVLARVTGAPAGVKGISLFLVPKWLVDESGQLGERNDVHCARLEHKLGIKACPTAELRYGERGGAIGYLVGEENRGLEYMFVMMNASRFAVGVQGVAISERAYQQAVNFARERIQSRPVDGSSGQAVAIIQHPDVKRMLLTMRSLTEGCRALAFVTAALCDAMHAHPSASERARKSALHEFLVPVFKGFSSEVSLEVTSLGIQVHGGMGFMDATGPAQHFRDARILPIYEGTTAIQANDLIARKTLRDAGLAARELAGLIEATERELLAHQGDATANFALRLSIARRAFEDVVEFVCAHASTDPNAVFAGSVPYLMLSGVLVVGWQWGRALLVAERHLAAGTDIEFMSAKAATAGFYADHVLSRAPALRVSVIDGASTVARFPSDAF